LSQALPSSAKLFTQAPMVVSHESMVQGLLSSQDAGHGLLGTGASGTGRSEIDGTSGIDGESGVAASTGAAMSGASPSGLKIDSASGVPAPPSGLKIDGASDVLAPPSG
jgi:hypothetical protein